MAFGQRGVVTGYKQHTGNGLMPDINVVVVKPDKPFVGDTVIGKEFDLDMGSDQIYANGKTLMAFIPLWLFFSGLGWHRFYLGHMRLGFAIMGVSAVVFYFNIGLIHLVLDIFNGRPRLIHTGFLTGPVLALTHLAWLFFDGVYVICRKLADQLGRPST